MQAYQTGEVVGHIFWASWALLESPPLQCRHCSLDSKVHFQMAYLSSQDPISLLWGQGVRLDLLPFLSSLMRVVFEGRVEREKKKGYWVGV